MAADTNTPINPEYNMVYKAVPPSTTSDAVYVISLNFIPYMLPRKLFILLDNHERHQNLLNKPE